MADGRSHFSIREPGLRASPDSLLEVAQTLNAAPYVVTPDQARHGLVVAGDDDLLASRDTLEKLAEPSFCFEGGDGSVCPVSTTSPCWSSRRRMAATHDQKTMPTHFGNFTRSRNSPGLIVVPQSLAIREVADSVILIWVATEPEEWTNRIAYLPI